MVEHYIFISMYLDTGIRVIEREWDAYDSRHTVPKAKDMRKLSVA